MDFDEFRIKSGEFRIKNDEFRINIDEFCITNAESLHSSNDAKHIISCGDG